jgi:hypothetical protein
MLLLGLCVCVCVCMCARMHVHGVCFYFEANRQTPLQTRNRRSQAKVFSFKRKLLLWSSLTFESENPLNSSGLSASSSPVSSSSEGVASYRLGLLQRSVCSHTAFTHVHYNNLHAFMTWHKSSVCKIQKYVSKYIPESAPVSEWDSSVQVLKLHYTIHHTMHERKKQVRITKDWDSIWKNLDTSKKNPNPYNYPTQISLIHEIHLHICMLADIWWKIKRLRPHLPPPPC